MSSPTTLSVSSPDSLNHEIRTRPFSDLFYDPPDTFTETDPQGRLDTPIPFALPAYLKLLIVMGIGPLFLPLPMSLLLSLRPSPKPCPAQTKISGLLPYRKNFSHYSKTKLGN